MSWTSKYPSRTPVESEWEIKRIYVELFEEEEHESTADLDFIDICKLCYDEAVYLDNPRTEYLYEDDTGVPPEMECDYCERYVTHWGGKEWEYEYYDGL